jgi:hypothetical protein
MMTGTFTASSQFRFTVSSRVILTVGNPVRPLALDRPSHDGKRGADKESPHEVLVQPVAAVHPRRADHTEEECGREERGLRSGGAITYSS